MTVTNFESSKQIVILCDLCFQEITNLTRIKCECQMDICVRCFFVNGCIYYNNIEAINREKIDISEYENDFFNNNFFHSIRKNTENELVVFDKEKNIYHHSPKHRFYCIEPLDYTVLDSKWTALEELIFFEMLVSHGIGNWAEIALNLKTKTPEEIEKHFYLIFNIENNTNLETKEKITTCSNPNNHRIGIFAPKRQDFDFEDEYDHELNLKFLEASENKIIKDFLLDSYKNLITLRDIKKNAIFEKKMTEIDYITSKKTLISEKFKQGIDIYNLCAPLAQFISKKDLNNFFNGILIESFFLNFKEYCTKSSSDILNIDKVRKQKNSKCEINIIENLNLTYSTYNTLKKHAILYSLDNSLPTLKNYSNDPRCKILLEFFKKKKYITT